MKIDWEKLEDFGRRNLGAIWITIGIAAWLALILNMAWVHGNNTQAFHLHLQDQSRIVVTMNCRGSTGVATQIDARLYFAPDDTRWVDWSAVTMDLRTVNYILPDGRKKAEINHLSTCEEWQDYLHDTLGIKR